MKLRLASITALLCLLLWLGHEDGLVVRVMVVSGFSPSLSSLSSLSRRSVTNTVPIPLLLRATGSGDDGNNSPETQQQEKAEEEVIKPDILKPFYPAADPNYMNVGPIGQDDFIISRTGGPTAQELSNENVLKIVQIESTDLEVNTLVWKCLGYRFDDASQSWTNTECFPKWKEKYPTPPDFIGMQRIYERNIDQPSLRANQALVRSVPVASKQSLKTHLKPLGFKGYQYAELTPNKTRRAQCANFVLYFREELFGFSIEELQARRQAQQAKEEQEKMEQQKQRGNGTAAEEEWKPPVREVY